MPSATRSPRRANRRTRRPLTDEERAARRAADAERIEQAVRELRTTEGWQRWLRARAAFHRYSALNCMLIAMQCPHATRVAPIAAWNRLGRRVVKGEKAIAINVFKGTFTVERDDGSEEQVPRFQLKGCLFDLTQTEGDDLPEPPSEPVTGDSHAEHLPPLLALAAELEYDVRFEPAPGSAEGYCNPREKVIVVDDALPANGRVHVLVHEIAHALGIGYDQYTRARAETLVESITYIVCRGIGLDTGGASVPYVAGWDDEDLAPLREFAGTVDEIARRIEAVLHPNDPKEHDQ
jgi:N-terminal domain of anti-restriction factor ArdC